MTQRGGGLLMATAAAGLAVIVAVPVAFVVLQAVFPDIGHGSLARPLAHLPGLVADPKLIGMTLNTLMLGAAVAGLAALVAVPLALIRGLCRLPFAAFWDAAFLVPFMIPPYIATLGWILTLQPRGYLQQLAGVHLGGFLFSVAGMAFVMALNTFPLVYFAVSRSVAAIGGRYGDVARVFGATPARALIRITLPLATPALAASLLLVFAAAIEEYGTPAALGRRAGFEVLVTEIDRRVADWPVDLAGAALFSLVLVVLSLAAFLMQRQILARRSYVTTASRPQDKDRRPLGAWTLPVLALFGLVAVTAAGVPLAAILATALGRTISGGLALDNLGLQHFRTLAADGAGGLKALGLSLGLGVAAALVTGALGVGAAYAVVKTRLRGRALVDAMTALPHALPGVVVAVGLILAWNQPALPATPYNTPLILLLAYACLLLPQPVRYATAALHQIGDTLEEAARIAGAGRATAFRRIVLPLIAPSLVTAMLLVFAVATRELVASTLVAPVGTQTLSTFIWRQFDQGSVGLGMAMAFTAVVLTTALPLAVIAVMRRGGLVAE
jgi:iron(III) transport system permease protein